MSFRENALLWFLAALPVAAWLLISAETVRRRVARRFVSERLRGVSVPARVLRPWLLAAALALAVVAVAGPRAGFQVVPITARETNRVLAIDVSNSMAAEDVGTSRLSAARAIATQLAAAQQGRIAVVVFEASAAVVSPLTTDSEAVISLIETLQPGEVGEPGSDLGGAVLAALRLVERDPAQKADIVILSDGEDQKGRAGEAIARAKERGVRISAILLGTAAGGTIPTPAGPLRDDSGQIVTTRAEAAVLSELVRGTGGLLLENPFAQNALDPLLHGDAAGTAREIEARIPIERYQWPLGAALLLFLAASLLNRGAE
jgi:Ca-activated chloride channel family protein